MEKEIKEAQMEVVDSGEKGQEAQAPQQAPVFEEIEGMNPSTAVGVLIQAAEMAQKGGLLSMRDSVVLAKAINVLSPGRI